MTDLEEGDLTAAESVYAAWDLERQRDPALSFEDLCARHPELAAPLRVLHPRYQDIQRMFGSAGSPLPFDPDVDPGPFANLLARLRRRQEPAEGRYEERDLIGEGGMGSVLEVYDVDLRRSVAKKVIRNRDGASSVEPRMLGRFIAEAQVTAQLGHPGIVPVHEIGVDEEDRIYFTMNRVEGRTLGQVFALVREGGEEWSLTRAVGVLERVCETLAFAHTRDVIHRDLKPDNVMVGSFGEVYVMDWGLAKVLGSPEERAEAKAEALPTPARSPVPVTTDRREVSDRDTFADLRTESGQAAGTPGFMSPEQARGEIEALDARTDVFSMGALLYTLLAGAQPLESELRARHAARYAQDPAVKNQALQRLWNAMALGTYRPLEEVAPLAPPELVSIAQRAMSPRAEDRYPDANAMRGDLRAWLEGRVVSAHESGPWAELRKWVGRNKPLAGALLGGVLVLLAGLAGMYTVEARGRTQVQAEQARTLRLADTRLHDQLAAEEPRLWPAVPATLPALDSWLERAAGLLAGRDQHLRDLEHLKSLARSPAAEASALRFERNEDAWQHEVLLGLLAELDRLAPEYERVEARQALARDVDERTLSGTEARGRWRAATEAIAALPAYNGLALSPQLGLLPLRQDPASGLWEFWHVLSGAEPVLDPATDRWLVEEGTGVVLILIPGGTYTVGTRDVPDGHAFSDEYKHADNSAVLNHTVELDPYFISKYELTQAQWRRARDSNDSRGREGPETHPADMVSWDGAFETLRRLDLELPTEAQWEAAGRGGADTRFYTGPTWHSLVGHVVMLPDEDLDYYADVDEDGNIVELFGRPWRQHHEPVGERLPNPFGLHDVHGNVWEWCLDTYDPSAAPRPGDGLRVSRVDNPQRVKRGGAFSSPWPNARLTYRYVWERHNNEPDVGVRPARSVR